MKINHHHCALVHRPLWSFKQLTALFVVSDCFMACRNNVRIQLHLTFKIKLIPGKGFVKTITTYCFVFVEDLVFFADKRTLFVLYVFDGNRLDT